MLPVPHTQLQGVEEAQEGRENLGHNSLAHKVSRMSRHHQQTVKCLKKEANIWAKYLGLEKEAGLRIRSDPDPKSTIFSQIFPYFQVKKINIKIS